MTTPTPAPTVSVSPFWPWIPTQSRSFSRLSSSPLPRPGSPSPVDSLSAPLLSTTIAPFSFVPASSSSSSVVSFSSSSSVSSSPPHLQALEDTTRSSPFSRSLAMSLPLLPVLSHVSHFASLHLAAAARGPDASAVIPTTSASSSSSLTSASQTVYMIPSGIAQGVYPSQDAATQEAIRMGVTPSSLYTGAMFRTNLLGAILSMDDSIHVRLAPQLRRIGSIVLTHPSRGIKYCYAKCVIHWGSYRNDTDDNDHTPHLACTATHKCPVPFSVSQSEYFERQCMWCVAHVLQTLAASTLVRTTPTPTSIPIRPSMEPVPILAPVFLSSTSVMAATTTTKHKDYSWRQGTGTRDVHIQVPSSCIFALLQDSVVHITAGLRATPTQTDQEKNDLIESTARLSKDLWKQSILKTITKLWIQLTLPADEDNTLRQRFRITFGDASAPVRLRTATTTVVLTDHVHPMHWTWPKN